MSIYIDLTEVIAEPHRTGIQRVTAELCRHWPDSTSVPVKVRSDGTLVRLPEHSLSVIGGLFHSGTANESIRQVREIHEHSNTNGSPITLLTRDILLCPEVFFDSARVGFYERQESAILNRACFIVYDLLPLTHPQCFRAAAPQQILGRYFCLLRRIGNLSFISESTQRVFSERFLRAPSLVGNVATLGCDGLGPRPSGIETFNRPRTFVVVGTIEPRKNHGLILDAFEQIWSRVPDVKLVFAGRFGWIEQPLLDRIQALRDRHPQFQVVNAADDGTIREHVRNARATIFVSSAEGFGLPPVESLWLGTPVIASSGIPSLEGLGSRGVYVLDSLEPGELRAAVVSFLDDLYHRKKCLEAREVRLQTWEAFGHDTYEWVKRAHDMPCPPAQAYN